MDRKEICEQVDAWFADRVEPGKSLYNSELVVLPVVGGTAMVAAGMLVAREYIHPEVGQYYDATNKVGDL